MWWLVPMVGFAVGAMVAAAAVGRFRRQAAAWNRTRRVLTAAALAPAAIAILVALANLHAYLTLPEGGEGGRDVAILIYSLVGFLMGIPALLGGLIGAALAERAVRP